MSKKKHIKELQRRIDGYVSLIIDNPSMKDTYQSVLTDLLVAKAQLKKTG